MSRLAGKVAVITGGSSGIGLATAQRFVQEGAYVFITGRRQSELDNATALIGDGVSTVAGDVTLSTDLDRLFATVLQEEGGLDILVVKSGRLQKEELGKITEQNFDATFDVNARASLFTVQKALPLMRTGGSVILVARSRAMWAFAATAPTAPPRPPCVPMSGRGPASSPTAASGSTR
jgi:NAD(P)-dependent dehydrogenase (short-subunit alcohol dehydrogenase family)